MQTMLHKGMCLAICFIISLAANLCMGAEWQTAQIGDGTQGDATITDREITVNAITGDIWGAADTAIYVYQEASGDVDFSARVKEYNPSNPGWGKAGLMIRQSVDADSANAFINLTLENGMKLIHRDTVGGETGPGDDGVPFDLPIYLRLTRTGDRITAFTSQDGSTWQEAGGGTGPSADIPMTGPIVVGLALSSNDANSASIVFDTFGGAVATSVEPQEKLTTTWARLKTTD